MSQDVVATDFRCSVGSVEFSFGGCDRKALQDILQFLCGVREDGLPASFAAAWTGERSKYELRRVDDGEVDDSPGRGLFFDSGKRTSIEESRGESLGVPGGLGGRSVGLEGRKSVGSFGHTGDDVALDGQKSITAGSSGGVGGRSGVRVGSTTGGVASVDLGGAQLPVGSVPFVTIVRGQDRGPRYEYNKAQREKRKERKRQSQELKSTSGGWRAPVRTEKEQELHELRVERQIIQEKRKLDKLKSPAQMVEDAMRQIEFAEKCARKANDNRVAAWAAELSSISAESVAKAAGYVEKSSGKSVSVVGGQSRDERIPAKPSVISRPMSAQTGAVSASGRSLRSDGLTYTKKTAGNWVRGYAYIEKYCDGRPDEEVAKAAFISVAEVKKYHRLKAEFNL